jgi:K+-sensing histidine kinase KdpD
MKISALLVAGDNPRFKAVAIEALDAAFPGAAVANVNSLAEALATKESIAPELLVLANPDEATISEAVQPTNSGRLPRWAVVAMGDSDPIPFAETIPGPEWTPTVLARAFRSSVTMHVLHQERDRLRGDLLSVGIRICHDLRTPLGGILSAAEVLDATMPERSKDEKSLTQPVVESAGDLAKIIGQLSLLSKASARPETRQHFNMETAVGRALDRVELRVREKRATLSKPKTWPDAKGDPAHAEAIWVGLLDNAIRHSGTAPKIALGWDPSGDGNRFWVRDSGGGLAPEKRRSLFQPFHRLHEPSAPRGLGLPIVERLVKIQGGQCGYEDGNPTGSTFYFTLPG